MVKAIKKAEEEIGMYLANILTPICIGGTPMPDIHLICRSFTWLMCNIFLWQIHKIDFEYDPGNRKRFTNSWARIPLSRSPQFSCNHHHGDANRSFESSELTLNRWIYLFNEKGPFSHKNFNFVVPCRLDKSSGSLFVTSTCIPYDFLHSWAILHCGTSYCFRPSGRYTTLF